MHTTTRTRKSSASVAFRRQNAYQAKQWKNLYTVLQKRSYASYSSAQFFNFEHGLPTVSDVCEFRDYKRAQRYADICCEAQRCGPFYLKSTMCRNPRDPSSPLDKRDAGRYKVFVCGFANLYEYGRAIAEQRISLADHMKLYDFIAKQQRLLQQHVKRPTIIVNHNKDVDILHFKFRCRGVDGACGYTRK
jgi:hypothetical protein